MNLTIIEGKKDPVETELREMQKTKKIDKCPIVPINLGTQQEPAIWHCAYVWWTPRNTTKADERVIDAGSKPPSDTNAESKEKPLESDSEPISKQTEIDLRQWTKKTNKAGREYYSGSFEKKPSTIAEDNYGKWTLSSHNGTDWNVLAVCGKPVDGKCKVNWEQA